jgi:hypothetical protein
VSTQIGRIRSKGDPSLQTQYLFDEELEAAVKQKEPGLEVIRPVVAGRIVDWEAIEIFLYDIGGPQLMVGDGYYSRRLGASILLRRLMPCHLSC